MPRNFPEHGGLDRLKGCQRPEIQSKAKYNAQNTGFVYSLPVLHAISPPYRG